MNTRQKTAFYTCTEDYKFLQHLLDQEVRAVDYQRLQVPEAVCHRDRKVSSSRLCNVRLQEQTSTPGPPDGCRLLWYAVPVSHQIGWQSRKVTKTGDLTLADCIPYAVCWTS